MPHEIRGFEYDWLAADGDGHIALFSTAGGGYAPEAFRRDTDAHDAVIEAILASEPRTRAQFARLLPTELENTWKRMAERGIYAFDGDPNGGPYRLVAAPEVPSLVRDLPAVAEVLVDVTFPSLRFGELPVVTADMLRSGQRVSARTDP